MKTLTKNLSKTGGVLGGALALAVVGMSNANAAAIVCGDLSLGTRTVTVDPALSCLHAGLTNLGDGALITLVDSLISPETSVLIDRDTVNSNGGTLSITGVGAETGSWSFASSVWDDYARVFLYFHFGDGPDRGGATDPDIFIVELAPSDTSGTWTFGGADPATSLSNIALIGSGDGGGGGDDEIPEPGILFLMGAGLMGLGYARRRKQ